MPPKATTTNSGIKKLGNGESIIPSSTRADGSVRKEIRVKPGYKPPEDVEVYKNRTAEAWKDRGKGGVPGADAVEQQPAQSAAANKNAKRREARKKAAAATGDGNEQDDENQISVKDGNLDSTTATSKVTPSEADPDAEKAKEVRKLAKKLRQARELQEKQASGSTLPPEQLEKVNKIDELTRQLGSLGFDDEGEKKGPHDNDNGPS